MPHRELDRAEMPTRSGTRVIGPHRVLLAHGATSACAALKDALAAALGQVELLEECSLAGARAALHQRRPTLCFACLDLAPAPLAGSRVALEARRMGVATILVTRGLRWVAAEAAELRDAVWVSPEATVAEVAGAILTAQGQRAALVDPRRRGSRAG